MTLILSFNFISKLVTTVLLPTVLVYDYQTSSLPKLESLLNKKASTHIKCFSIRCLFFTWGQCDYYPRMFYSVVYLI